MLAIIGFGFMSLSANAAMIEFDVQANANSVSGGVGVNTGLMFNAGDTISGFVGEDDLWSAGALPRWSNANGLVVDLFATGSDDSGEAAGVQIGRAFGNHTRGAFSFAFGTLVGEINGEFFALGTDFDVVSTETGTLSLFYWDSDRSNNRGLVTVSIENGVTAVSAPTTVLMLILSVAGIAGARQMNRRKI